MPNPMRVPVTSRWTMSPEGRASRPITTAGRGRLSEGSNSRRIHSAYPWVERTMSGGVRLSPSGPPMVPRKPEMLRMNVMLRS